MFDTSSAIFSLAILDSLRDSLNPEEYGALSDFLCGDNGVVNPNGKIGLYSYLCDLAMEYYDYFEDTDDGVRPEPGTYEVADAVAHHIVSNWRRGHAPSEGLTETFEAVITSRAFSS